jgi:hypothetical protein
MRLASLHIALGLVGLTLASSVALADPATDRAMPWGPRAWCADGGLASVPYCHYDTYQQCRADVRGDGEDNCTLNPFYGRATDTPRTPARHRRHS